MNPLNEYPFNYFVKAACLTDPQDPNFDKPIEEVNLKSNPNI